MWSEQDIDLLRDMAAKGATARQIVDALSVQRTRSAVLGACHRYGIKLLNGSNYRVGRKQTHPKVEKPKPAPRPKPEPVEPAADFEQKLIGGARITLAPTKFECRAVPITQVRDGQCKWPVNNAERAEVHLFCGNPTDDVLHPYCQPHARRAKGNGTVPERVATKVPARMLK